MPSASTQRGRWPEVDSHERLLLLLLGVAAFFNRYDEGLFALLLVQIQSDLGISEAQVGFLGSFVRMGSLPAVAVLFLADRIGRRRILLWTIAGYTATTAATAVAPTYEVFVGLQFLARMFMTAEFALGFVFIVEEFRPGNRAWGIAVLGTLSALGYGLAMVLFGFVDRLPLGWRTLYLVGVGPLLVVANLRRRLPETHRFEAVHASGTGAPLGWLGPLRTLVGRYPGRFVAVAFVTFFWAFSNGPVDFFLPKYCQEVQGWPPARFATIAILGGGLGLTGQLIAGWLSDRYGRRPNAVSFLFLEPSMAILVYTLLGPIVLPFYVFWTFASVASDVVGRTYGSELFPTSARSTAAGAFTIVGTLGSVLGLATEGLLFQLFDSHWTPVRIVAATGFLLPIVVYLVYPETRGRTLEDISPEAVGAIADAGLQRGEAEGRRTE